jgi:hypothetical protein
MKPYMSEGQRSRRQYSTERCKLPKSRKFKRRAMRATARNEGKAQARNPDGE